MDQLKVLTTSATNTTPNENEAPLTYCLYARKSSEQDERQALSIDSQIKEMMQLAARDGLYVAEIRQESHSAKDSAQRPVFNQLLADIRSGKFNAILTWNADRLSRNAGDLGSLVDLMDQKLLHEIRAYGQRFTNSPNEKFLLMILCSQAKLENDNKSVNVKRGLKTKCEMGYWPSQAPTGYLNSYNIHQKGHVFVDPKRAPIIKEMFIKVAQQGYSGRRIFQWLNEIKFTTKSGKPLTLSNIYLLLNNHFYYGTFEYPKDSGHWYQGKHVPLIDKVIFDAVQAQIKLQRKVRGKNKEFAFTRLMSCGLCGSGISAEEKYKNLKDGTLAKYIYYGCSRFYNKSCKNFYIREEELTTQLLEMIDQIDLDKSGVRKKLEQEIERHKRFQIGMLGKIQEPYTAIDLDIRNYAKYLLSEGSIFEKRDLLGCLRSKIVLENKSIYLKV